MNSEHAPFSTTSFKTPFGLKMLAIACITAPIVMMVHNTDVKVKELTVETETLSAENGLLAQGVKQGREKNAALKVKLQEGEVQRDDLLAKLDRSERKETSLQKVVGLLTEELTVAGEESKLVAATYQKSTNQLRHLVTESEETAYSLLQDNRELKELARRQEMSMITMLGEVSTLNTELAYIKDERDEMGREILRITAQVKSLEADTGVMQVNAAEVMAKSRSGG